MSVQLLELHGSEMVGKVDLWVLLVDKWDGFIRKLRRHLHLAKPEIGSIQRRLQTTFMFSKSTRKRSEGHPKANNRRVSVSTVSNKATLYE